MAPLSDKRRDKLLAALNHDSVDPEQRLPLGYLEECIIWYGGLSALDKMLVTGCRAAYERGIGHQAARAAEALPPSANVAAIAARRLQLRRHFIRWSVQS